MHDTQNSRPCSRSFALERTRVLMGCFRKGEAEDPEVYVAAIASVLAAYPENVTRAVTDPRGGLPSRQNWLPTVAEVKAACEERMKPRRHEERLAHLIGQGERHRIEPPRLSEAEREAIVERRWERGLRAILASGERGSPKAPPRSLAELADEYGVDLAAIPDDPNDPFRKLAQIRSEEDGKRAA